jgi:hypothetical protein
MRLERCPPLPIVLFASKTALLFSLSLLRREEFFGRYHRLLDNISGDVDRLGKTSQGSLTLGACEMAIAQGVHTACGLERIPVSKAKPEVLAFQAKVPHSGLNEVSKGRLNSQKKTLRCGGLALAMFADLLDHIPVPGRPPCREGQVGEVRQRLVLMCFPCIPACTKSQA